LDYAKPIGRTEIGNGRTAMLIDRLKALVLRASAFAPFLILAAALSLPVFPASAFETPARQALLMDMGTGSVLFEKNANEPMPPASMSKLMTIYLLFERLRDGRLKLDDTLPVSENAWRKGGAKSGSSTMFLEPRTEVKVEDLIQGIIVQSGNDASIVVAEGLLQSEEAFAQEMTKRGRELGMRNTVFRNATGWPDPEHLTTAHDLAVLAQRTIEDFPQYYPYYSEKEFTYNGIRQGNRNPLLYKDLGADGLKTGHTKASGYGLIASARKDDRRLILVINGLKDIRARSREANRLISLGFREFANYALFKAGEEVSTAEVWLGKAESVALVVDRDLTVTLPNAARPEMKVSVAYDGPIPAPITEGDRLAVLRISAPGVETVEVPLVAGNSVEKLGFLGRLFAALKHLVQEQIF
jgi:D-alanyl-D-alanine carboxypeptidase (penicillin-binding protein 5/6)